MAANMQHMGGVGQMMPQQMRKPANAGRLQQFVYQNLLQQAQAPNALAWQANITINDRMGKTMDLISNISLAGNGIDPMRAAEFGCNCEREIYVKSPNKEAYDQAMSNKILEYFKKRQANEPNLQNTLNAQAQAAQAAQAQAMNMQAQMGHGLAQLPQQAFQHLQHPMQASHIPQHAQQQPQTHQKPMGMGMGMCVGLQAARGAMPPGLGAQQAMGMATGLNRPPQQLANEMSRFAQADKAKVMELATKMMSQANEQLKSTARAYVQQRLPPQQLADFQSQGKDPAIWFFQAQAFHALKTSMQNRMQQQGGVQNPNVGQAALMQQQHSQQSLPPRQNIMNPGQPNEFSHFTSNMESIKDQQNIGFRAQQAGQMVVPASNGGARNATPQPGNQNMVGQPGPNQTPRQPQQQHPQHQMQQQPQHQQGANLQQMKMNQAQTPQAHLQMKQIQGQNSISGGIPPSQSPAMNTLNTPVSRPPSGMNAMVGPGMGQQGGMQFGDQRFNQGIQRPNNQAFNNMLSSMSQDQRQALHGMPTEKLNEVMRRWQSQRQEQVAMGAGQMNQKRPPQQFGGHMNMAGPQGMQQPPGPGVGNQQQQMQMPRISMQTAQAQALMDQMDLPPQVHSQLGQLPGEVKKWRDLKMWLSQNNNSLPPAIRSQLFALQQKQFQILMHRRVTMSGQNQGGIPGQMPNQQLGMQRPAGNVPPHILQVTPQEIMQVRSQSANFAGLSDDKMQTMILQMKKQAWFQQQQKQQQQMRAQQAQAQAQLQANPQAQGQPGGQGQMPVVAQAALPMQPTPQPHQLTPQQIRTPQPHPQGTPNTAGQSAAMQGGTPKQQPPGPQVNDQSRNRAQAPKNLKRPSTDETPDTAGPANASSAASRAASQTNQQAAKSFTSLTPQQLASLKPEQRARDEQYLKMHLSGQAQAASAEALNHLRQLSQEEQRKFSQEPMPDIPMNQQEHNDTAAKLQRISMDMQKVSRGLTKWYSITRDDARANMFFRTRMRIVKQFCDSDSMRELKDKFSVRSSDIDQARAILESMAKDLAASMMKSGMLKQTGQAQQNQATVQGQGAPPPPPPPPQQQQQQQGQPVPLNAANLEKNSQAISKMSQQRPGAKVSQVPPAPKATAPPFPFGESSPHGNPSYMGKPKDMNLQLPPARKKQKTAGQQAVQGTQGASPSPKTSKNASPEMRRAVEPPKPVLLCKDAECASSAVGFSSEQALRQHVDEEHVKPKENPVKFVKENLALALALEPDGSLKKPRQASAAMKTSTSKQGHHGTPGQVASTPLAHEASMKRTGSAGSRPLDGRVTGKTDGGGASRQVEGKTTDGGATRADPWAGCTIDPQAFIANLGWEKGIGLPDIVGEANMYRSLTPKDTPGSSKDSGSSEPNSDISEGAALDIDVYWRNYENLDADLLLEFDKAKLEGDMVAKEANGQTLDPMVLMKAPFGQSSDWDDIDVDYGKAWELDTRLYSMAT